MKSSSTSHSSAYAAAIAVVLAIVLPALGGVEWLLRNGGGAKRIRAVYSSPSNDIILGDSQILYALREELAGFEQMAKGGLTPEAIEIVAREYFRYRDPRRIIVGVGPQFFARNRVARGTWSYENYYTQNTWLNQLLGIRLFILDPGINQEFDVILRERLTKIFGRTGQSTNRESTKEVVKRRPPWFAWSDKTRARYAINRVRAQRPVENYVGAAPYQAFENTLEFLAGRGAQVCMVRPPISSEYIAAAISEPLFREADSRIRLLAEQHGARYVDFRELPLDYESSVFYNQDHLTRHAARSFAPLLLAACFGGPHSS